MNSYYISVASNPRVKVYESSGSGQNILLLHGNSLDSRTYQNQFEGEFGTSYRVFAVDFPGHGGTHSAADPVTGYALPGLASFLLEIVDVLKLDSPVIIGWCLGGHVLLEALPSLRQARGIVIFGTPPVAKPDQLKEAFLNNTATAGFFRANNSETDVKRCCAACFADEDLLPPHFIESFCGTDNKFREAFGESVSGGRFLDEIRVCKETSIPMAILHGEQDRIISAGFIQSLKIPSLWRGNVQLIRGAGHAPHWEKPQKFNQVVMEFIDDLTD